MEVDIRLEGVDVATDAVEADARRILEEMGLPDAELSLVLCDDPFIHALNRDYRGKDRPTDVLSFSMREGEEADPDDPVLGDVVISLDTAARQAAEQGHPLDQEVRHLLVHGVLHLLGHDHEEDDEAAQMDAVARHLLQVLSQGPAGAGADRTG